jgi:hypothetical protein
MLNKDDFEYSEEPDIMDALTSETAKVTARYLDAKERLEFVSSDAVNAAYDFGYLIGGMDKAREFITMLESLGQEDAAVILKGYVGDE